MGATVSTTFRILNSTNSAIVSIFACDFDDFDFGRDLRPDKIFNRISHQIPSNSFVERTIELNPLASNCPFTLRIKFANGSEDEFKINYKCAYDDTEPNLRLLKRCHSIVLHKPQPRALEVRIENTTEQKQEIEEAFRAKAVTDQVLAQKQYGKAFSQLWGAPELPNEPQEKPGINTNQLMDCHSNKICNPAIDLYLEGCEFMKAKHFEEALNKFKEALRYAADFDTIEMIRNIMDTIQQQKNHQDMKKLTQEGLLFRKTDRNEDALRKFNEALAVSKNAEPELIMSIKSHKFTILRLLARSLLEETYELEQQKKLKEAIEKFSKVKEYLMEAHSIFSSRNLTKLIKVLELKIQGNTHLILAQKLESEAMLLQYKVAGTDYESTFNSGVKRQYEYAKQEYEKAKKIFERGAENVQLYVKFDENISFVLECLENIDLKMNKVA